MSDIRENLVIVPFVYAAKTRLHGGRDYLYLIASQWGLGTIVLFYLHPDNPFIVLVNYLIGYFVFISIYELGYLANDVWDAKRGDGGRARFTGDLNIAFIASFVLIRIGIWIGLTAIFLKADLQLWLIANSALIFVFAAHNIFKNPEIRYATFVQLTLLRFALPIVFSLSTPEIEPIVIVTILHYFYFRGLAYLESKELLTMPNRKNPSFGFHHTVIILPVVLCIYAFTDSPLYLAAWAYMTAIYGAFSLLSQRQR